MAAGTRHLSKEEWSFLDENYKKQAAYMMEEWPSNLSTKKIPPLFSTKVQL
jgi:hypothetical protein